MNIPRGIRNCNPGNIRRTDQKWVGQRQQQTDKHFVQFQSMTYGLRALWRVLYTYYSHYHLRTIEQIVRRYAPPSENDTLGYTERVHRLTGMSVTQELPDPSLTLYRLTWQPIVKAICQIETIYTPTDAELHDSWMRALYDPTKDHTLL